MKASRKPIVPITVVALVVVGLFAFSCKFSFADEKRPSKGTLNFGADTKPKIKTSAQFESFKNVFADVAEKVIPTVVSITSTKIDTFVQADPFNQFFGQGPFQDFFGTPRGRQAPKAKPQERRQTGFGSGVIVSGDGYILTNYHVVGGADEIIVELADEREFDAEIIGVDSLSDVAVIKISEKVKDLPVAYLGNSRELRPGDWVMAAGNPFNLSSTVTTGIISAVGRYTGGITTYQNFIQTDAAINPGNSGGALVNIDGELIGINSMIYTRSGGYMGIGFAIPINMAKKIMEQLIYDGSVSRGWLGVQIGDIDQSMKEALGLKSKKGVLINDVFSGQPADKAGIKSGDVVLSIDGVRTANANELKNTVASIQSGKKVPVEIIRNGRTLTLTCVLSERDESKIGKMKTGGSSGGAEDDQAEADLTEKLGFTVGNLTGELRERLEISDDVKGVAILKLEPSSFAARKGLKKYDIIQKIKIKGGAQTPVANIRDFEKIAKKAPSDSSILVHILRGGNSFYVAFKIK